VALWAAVLVLKTVPVLGIVGTTIRAIRQTVRVVIVVGTTVFVQIIVSVFWRARACIELVRDAVAVRVEPGGLEADGCDHAKARNPDTSDEARTTTELYEEVA